MESPNDVTLNSYHFTDVHREVREAKYFLCRTKMSSLACSVSVISFCLLQTIIAADPKIILERAGATYFFIDVQCDNKECEGNFQWQIKTLPSGDWTNYSNVHKRLRYKKYYNATGFEPNAVHNIRVKIGDKISNELSIRTCETEAPPAVKDLRAEKTGPGWLDVRWTPVKEECFAHYNYHVRYKVEGEEFSNEMMVGSFPNPEMEGRVKLYPHHPCDTYPRDFCVLLTDRVKAGMSHTVEVYVTRLDTWDKSRRISMQVIADPKNLGYEDPEQCVPDWDQLHERKAISPSTYKEQDGTIRLPLWALVSFVAVVIVIAAVAVIVFQALRLKKIKTRNQGNPGVSNLPSVRYRRNRQRVEISCAQQEIN